MRKVLIVVLSVGIGLVMAWLVLTIACVMNTTTFRGGPIDELFYMACAASLCCALSAVLLWLLVRALKRPEWWIEGTSEFREGDPQ
jgi:hypothetical protein